MDDQNCIQNETIGKIKEFIDGMKGFKATLLVMSITIVVQVGSFLFLWGGLTTTVGYHDRSITKLEVQVDSLRYNKVGGPKAE